MADFSISIHQTDNILFSLWAFVDHAKDVASIITPIIITVVGLHINKTIQVQNKREERRSDLAKQWATDFSKLSQAIYSDSIKVIINRYQISSAGSLLYNDQDVDNMNKSMRDIMFKFEMHRFEIDQFISIAPNIGDFLKNSFNDLHIELGEWFSAKSRNVQNLQTLQRSFNECVRNTHREILGVANR